MMHLSLDTAHVNQHCPILGILASSPTSLHSSRRRHPLKSVREKGDPLRLWQVLGGSFCNFLMATARHIRVVCTSNFQKIILRCNSLDCMGRKYSKLTFALRYPGKSIITSILQVLQCGSFKFRQMMTIMVRSTYGPQK